LHAERAALARHGPTHYEALLHFWVRILPVKTLPLPRGIDHLSYKAHRRQVGSQILLPVLIGVVVFVAGPIIAWLAAFGGAGDVGRWAEISTMWLLIPVMIGGAIQLAALVALIYGIGRVIGWIPQYSYRAQRIAARIQQGTRRGTEMIRRPVLAVRELGTLAKAGLLRLRERV
jgi:hypothetical protein